MKRTIDETEERFKEELENKIRDLKADFEEKLKDEMEGGLKELNDKHVQRVKTLREEADNDKELVQRHERMADAAAKVSEFEDDMVKAKKKIGKLCQGVNIPVCKAFGQ